MPILEAGSLESEIDESELLTALVTVYEEQKLEPLLDFMQQDILGTRGSASTISLVTSLIKLTISSLHLRSLKPCLSSSAQMMTLTHSLWGCTIGQVVRGLGVEAAVKS